MAPESLKSKKTPWAYVLIRLLFKFVLKVFYASIVIENEDFIPGNGCPTIICANHGNSLTDAIMIITSVSSKKRNFLRMTAKSTLFGKRTFSSWLIESVGSVPVKRRQDNPGDNSDNTLVLNSLVQALEEGDAICLFPEGMSKYQSKLSPIKTGAARIASDTLSRNLADPDFEVTLLTCSIAYVHPSRFRSDVLVTFNPPLHLRPSTHPSLIQRPGSPFPAGAIQSLTRLIQTQLSSGIIDAPSWEIVQVSKTAARMYAPFGTRMSLGDWVRVVRAFICGFAPTPDATTRIEDEEPNHKGIIGRDAISVLIRDLKAYQGAIDSLGLKDDRIRRPASRPSLLWRLILRLGWLGVLLPMALPGLVLWTPIFLTASYYGNKMKRSGPVSDVYDEIAQQKLIYGLLSGTIVWLGCILTTLPLFWLTFWLVPVWMWMTLRWTEDLTSTFRAVRAISKMLYFHHGELRRLRQIRDELHERVHSFAVGNLGLPEDPEKFFVLERRRSRSSTFDGTTSATDLDEIAQTARLKGRVGGRWDAIRRYFSIVRRRKRDWNETIRWYDMTEFPDDSTQI
ncbi:uncharacterized protein EI90DRAFT_3051548 [Cantharellus anzutake]|uniref:uncharacterized protein n=1 Tax=Cantharellus anzutake TaxID=1750568 RepID=UPI0019068230|nr:uncharacterized protein EI90DRAFT_3051548 [Cantharellus anzutake]KAF8334240.1 hypothetical protein EI90DRAFT_3051548 [Cantharellus anzutake]